MKMTLQEKRFVRRFYFRDFILAMRLVRAARKSSVSFDVLSARFADLVRRQFNEE